MASSIRATPAWPSASASRRRSTRPPSPPASAFSGCSSMAFPLFVQEIDKQGVARITLTRTEVHNAFNEALIAELTAALEGVGQDRRVRVVVLAAQGPSFSAGADLNWMKAMAGSPPDEHREDARRPAPPDRNG